MQLKEAIITAASAAQHRGTMPILSTVAIKAENGQVDFTGSDMQVGIKTTAQYDTKDFVCCIDAKRLVAAIGVLDKPEFNLAGSNLIIKQGRTRFALPALPFEHHPGIQEIDESGVELSADAIKMMADVRYAAGKNDVRNYLNGIYLEADNGMLTVAASDGHRISQRTLPADGEFNVILPTNAINQIIKYQPERLVVGTIMHCLKPGFEMVCNAIDSKYPDFKKIISRSDETITVSRSDLQRTLTALNVLRDTSPTVAVCLGWKDGMLTAISKGLDTSEAENQIQATYTSESEIGICLAYLIDMISAIPDDEITLAFSEKLGLSSHRDNALDLVMPMRL